MEQTSSLECIGKESLAQLTSQSQWAAKQKNFASSCILRVYQCIPKNKFKCRSSIALETVTKNGRGDYEIKSGNFGTCTDNVYQAPFFHFSFIKG